MSIYPPAIIQMNLALTAGVYDDRPDALDALIRNAEQRLRIIEEQKAAGETVNRKIFTPRLDRTEESRLKMFISAEDRKKTSYRGPGYRGIVTDLDTGKKWKVYGASCGIPNCYCDATAKEVTE